MDNIFYQHFLSTKSNVCAVFDLEKIKHMTHKAFNVLCKLANKNFNSILFDHCKFPIRRMIKLLQSSVNSKKISFKNCSFLFAKPILFTKDMRLECKIDFEKVKFNGEEFFSYFDRLARSGAIEASLVN